MEVAVEDIISRCTSEIRKNAFGDDLEDAKSLAWSREQAWAIMKQLANKPEVSLVLLVVTAGRRGTHMTH